MTNAGCWAHARRRFFDCIPEGDTACPSAKIVALIDKAAQYERTARENKYTAQQIQKMWSEIIKPLLDQVYTDPTEDQIKSVMPWSFALPAYCRQTYSEIQ